MLVTQDTLQCQMLHEENVDATLGHNNILKYQLQKIIIEIPIAKHPKATQGLSRSPEVKLSLSINKYSKT